MLKTNIKEKGFTIVELLIVIVIIGILGLLVLNTVTGAQKRARDSDRLNDTTALATQLEVYYNDKGGYPQLSQFADVAAAKALFPGIDEKALGAPGDGDGYSLAGSASTSKDVYGYEAGNCGSEADDVCESFTLTYTKEEDGVVVTKKSLNGPVTP